MCSDLPHTWKRMSSGIVRSLCSQTKAALSSENASSAAPSGERAGDKGWDGYEPTPPGGNLVPEGALPFVVWGP